MAKAEAVTQSSTPPAPVVTDPVAAPSKTKAAVAGVEGYDAQAAKLVPPDASAKVPVGGPTPGAPQAPGAAPGAAPVAANSDVVPPAPVMPPEAVKPPAPTSGGTPAAADGKTPEAPPVPAPAAPEALPAEAKDGQVEKLSPIREALLKQFQLMEGKGVGDAEFDSVCSADTWNKIKAKEEAAKKKADEDFTVAMNDYNTKCAGDPNYAKSHPKPKKAVVPVYTTCIDTQAAIARAAWKASGLAVKRIEGQNFDQFAFGGNSRTLGKKLDAWVEGKPGSGATPKTGDMLMFEKAGDKVDKAAEAQRGAAWNFEPKVQKLEKQVKDLEAAAASASEAKAMAAQAKAADAEKALEAARAQYEAAKAKIQAQLTEAQAALAKRVEGGAKLEFSHVGFFKSASDEMKDGQPTGRQIWETFDGGQSGIAGAVAGQGAKSGKRYYDPKTNMIAGEASQGGASRWLAGWIDVDKMAKPGSEKKDAPPA